MCHSVPNHGGLSKKEVKNQTPRKTLACKYQVGDGSEAAFGLCPASVLQDSYIVLA